MKREMSKFWVVSVISNSVRYKSRVRLFKRFQAEMKAAGAQMIVVELAYGRRPFQVTDSGNYHHLQLRSRSELWHKEALINLGVRRLSEVDPNWRFFAWIDGDISFFPAHYYSDRQNWIRETVHQLQHHALIQMFQTAIDLGPTGEAFAKHDGFACAYVEGKFDEGTTRYTTFHPGYAWAMRRDAYVNVGGLIDTAILGAGDRHLAYGSVGLIEKSIEKGLNPGYGVPLLEWQARAARYIQKDIGFLPGTILHHFHGKKSDRRYHSRWKILTQNQFNPATDLKRNIQGLYELVVMDARQMRLRDEIRRYFRMRNEDSLELE
jgi:hypothetical protein